MKTLKVTVHQAKTELSRLIREAAKGNEVVISRGKTPVARLVAIAAASSPRQPGSLEGKFTILPSFYEPMNAEELKSWGIE
jgi:prevent-host-death family protein